MIKINKEQNELLDIAQDVLDSNDEDISVIVLVSGYLEDNAPHYAYARIDSKKYIPFKKAELVGNYELMDYADEILASGDGLNPTKAVQKEMEEKYGADHTFEDELQKLIKNHNKK